MSLLTSIESIVKEIKPDATYRLSSYFKANAASYEIAKGNYPLIILDNELNKTVQIMKNANLQAETRIRMYFLSHDNTPHKTDLEREAIRQSMEDIANRVMVKIYQLDEVKIIGTANTTYTLQPMFNAFITGLMGVRAEMLSNEQLIINWC